MAIAKLTEDKNLTSQKTLPPRSAYLHIPFCRRRCFYCDFPISVLGDRLTGDTSGSIHEYVKALCQEILTTPPLNTPLETVFFGGGTPSLLSVSQLSQILLTLDQHFGISPKAEISMEMDPGTFDLVQIQGYKALGVNRVSLGVQAFQDELLNICGRSHSIRDIYQAWEMIHQVQITNHSLDLISGLPHQTLDQWQDSLESALNLSPAHISCYDLIIEAVTSFGKQYSPGETPLPSDESAAQMYRMAQQTLTGAGYTHYEISNYAKEGYQCQHNRVYWQNLPYYGFGMGAASYTQGQRFTRPRTRREYYAWVEQGCLIQEPTLSERDRLLETLMLGLRLAEGVSLTSIRQEFGEETIQTIHSCLQPYMQSGWIQWQNERLSLSDPEGFLFSNTILADLFDKLD